MKHKPRKRFGQNFLHDQGIIQRIIHSIHAKEGEHLVEIGPGLGAITQQLLPQVGIMDAIELDRDLLQPLAESCAHLGQLNIHNADALSYDFTQLHKEKCLRVVGNLPYNISTPILFHLLDQAHIIQDMFFMLQKEVVLRMGAGPGSKTYGRLSVMLQAQCQVTPLFLIPPTSFNPAPKVDSMLVKLAPYRDLPYPVVDMAHLKKLVTQAFSQRRKTLSNSLKKMVTREQIEAADINPSIRPEQISVKEFIHLSNLLVNNPTPTH